MDKPWFKYYESNVPHYIDLPDCSINEIINEAITHNPKGIAISYFGKECSYGELGKLISHFAIALNRLGVKKGGFRRHGAATAAHTFNVINTHVIGNNGHLSFFLQHRRHAFREISLLN